MKSIITALSFLPLLGISALASELKIDLKVADELQAEIFQIIEGDIATAKVAGYHRGV